MHLCIYRLEKKNKEKDNLCLLKESTVNTYKRGLKTQKSLGNNLFKVKGVKEETRNAKMGDMKESPFFNYFGYTQICTPQTLILFHN